MQSEKRKRAPLPEIIRTCIGTILGIGGVALLTK